MLCCPARVASAFRRPRCFSPARWRCSAWPREPSRPCLSRREHPGPGRARLSRTPAPPAPPGPPVAATGRAAAPSVAETTEFPPWRIGLRVRRLAPAAARGAVRGRGTPRCWRGSGRRRRAPGRARSPPAWAIRSSRGATRASRGPSRSRAPAHRRGGGAALHRRDALVGGREPRAPASTSPSARRAPGAGSGPRPGSGPADTRPARTLRIRPADPRALRRVRRGDRVAQRGGDPADVPRPAAGAGARVGGVLPGSERHPGGAAGDGPQGGRRCRRRRGWRGSTSSPTRAPTGPSGSPSPSRRRAAGGEPLAHRFAALMQLRTCTRPPLSRARPDASRRGSAGTRRWPRTVTARGMVSLSPSDALMMSSLRSGMEEVRTVRRNGSSSTTSPGTGISLVPTGKLGDQVRRQGGPRARSWSKPAVSEEDVGIELPPAVLVADVGVGREVAQPRRDDAEPPKRHRARAAQILLAAGREPSLRQHAPARPATPRAGSP